MQLTSSVGMYQSSQTCTWPDCHSPSWTLTLRVHPNFSLVPAMISLQPFSEGGDLQPQKWGHKWIETPPWQGQKATVSLSWVGKPLPGLTHRSLVFPHHRRRRCRCFVRYLLLCIPLSQTFPFRDHSLVRSCVRD